MANFLTESKTSGLQMTFNWRDSRLPQRARLVQFLFFAFILHVGCFYVFQVVYPSTPRTHPNPSRVVLLGESDPAVRAILENVEDRVAAYSPDLGSPVGTVRLETYSRYRTSFADHVPLLKDLPDQVTRRLPLPGTSTNGLLLPEAGELPESLIEPVPPLPPGPEKAILVFGGALANREVVHRPEFKDIFPQELDTVATYSLGVNASGVVEFCIPDEGFHGDQTEALRRARALSRADEMAALRRALYQLRFKPEPGSGLRWGHVTIEW